MNLHCEVGKGAAGRNDWLVGLVAATCFWEDGLWIAGRPPHRVCATRSAVRPTRRTTSLAFWVQARGQLNFYAGASAHVTTAPFLVSSRVVCQVAGRSCGMDAQARIQVAPVGAHFSGRVHEKILNAALAARDFQAKVHLKARYRHALTSALEAVHTAVQRHDLAKEIRG